MITLTMLSMAVAVSASETEVKPVEEIIVTARKREERLKDIPASLVNIDSDALKQSGALSLKDIASFSPNLTMVDGQGMGTTTAIFVRGIGQSDSLQTFEQGVAVYFDGVPLPRMQGLAMRLFDVESIQVLRGPQGTLYGKNAVGGAVNIVTKPTTDTLTGAAELTYGTADHKQLSGYVSGPLSDTVQVMASALYSKRDGYYTDIVSGKEYADDDSLAARFKMDFTPNDRMKLTFAADVTDQDLAPTAQRAEDSLFITDLAFGVQTVYDGPRQDFRGDLQLSLDDDAGETLEQYGLSATLDYKINDAWSFKNILAYREMTSTIWWDLDGIDRVIADIEARWDQDQTSNEIQLHYQGDKLDTVFGAYYLSENSIGAQRSYLTELLLVAGTPPGLEQPGDDTLDTTSYALFMHSTYQLSDKVNIEAGIRWSKDEKSFVRSSRQEIGGVETGRFEFDDSDSWSSVTPSAAISYSASDNTNLFARVAKGFRSGGFNGRLSSVGDSESFRPETVWSYESGLKWSKGAVSANVTAFLSDYTDFQTRISRFADFTDPTVGFNFPTVNAADLTIYGLEADVTAVIGNFSLTANMGLLESEYGEFTDDSGDRSDNTPVFSPSLTAAINGNYHIDLDKDATVDLSFSLKHSGGYYASVQNTAALYQSSYQMINLAAEWQSGKGYYIRTGINNVTDELVLQGGLEFRTIGNIQAGYYGAPRHFYATVGMIF